MKTLRFLTISLGSILLYPISMLTAQTEFYSFDFTAAEGFVDGAIAASDPSGENWATWAGNTTDVTFTVDTAGSGNLVIDPTSDAFQLVKYVGPGSELTGNAYYGELKLTLSYTVGTPSVLSGKTATQLPAIALRGLTNQSRQLYFALRQVAPAETDPTNGNRFNLFNIAPIAGWSGAFSTLILGENIGLAIDENGNWSDGQSDELLLRFSAVHLGDNIWELTTSAYNLTTSRLLGTITQEITDANADFATQPHFLELQDDNMEAAAVGVKVDWLSVNSEPLPEMPAWAGFLVDEQGWVDTGAWMGMLYVLNDPWIWSQDLQAYIMVGGVTEGGAWAFVPGS